MGTSAQGVARGGVRGVGVCLLTYGTAAWVPEWESVPVSWRIALIGLGIGLLAVGAILRGPGTERAEAYALAAVIGVQLASFVLAWIALAHLTRNW